MTVNFRSAAIIIGFSTLSVMGVLLSKNLIGIGKYPNIAVVTYIADREQERSVKALVKSIRELGGKYQDSKVYIVLGYPQQIPAISLEGENVSLIPMEIERTFLEYPLAIKAFAAAKIEKIVNTSADIRTLIWMDPGVIVLKPFEALILDKNYDVVVRPVTLSNNIGLAVGEAPNAYWMPIFMATGLNNRRLPMIMTIADEVEIQPYYNCEVFCINPRLGICEEWMRILTSLLEDKQYQSEVCTTFVQKLFLHQAVLSAVISTRIEQKKIKSLPLTHGYPFNQYKRLPKSKQVASLNEISIVIFDYAWAKNPDWMDNILINEPLKQWLFNTYQEYFKFSEN